MKALKYTGSVVCVLLVIGTLPSMYLIAVGLTTGAVAEGDSPHFGWKLAAYFVEVVLLGFGAWWLAKSARASTER